MYCFSCYLALYLEEYLQYNIDITTVVNKALGIWNLLMQKSGFPKMRHYVGFLQIGSHIQNLKIVLSNSCVHV